MIECNTPVMMVMNILNERWWKHIHRISLDLFSTRDRRKFCIHLDLIKVERKFSNEQLQYLRNCK